MDNRLTLYQGHSIENNQIYFIKGKTVIFHRQKCQITKMLATILKFLEK